MISSEFKGHKFEIFEDDAGKNSFYMSPQKWIKGTMLLGLFQNLVIMVLMLIVLEFASWLSPEFKLYVIQEFQSLKKNEAYQNKMDWHANKVLISVNYVVYAEEGVV